MMMTIATTTPNTTSAPVATPLRQSAWVSQQSTIGFLVCTLSLVTAVYMAHIPLQVLIQPTALLLVVGGTLGALCLSNPIPQVIGSFWQSFFPTADEKISAKGLEDLVADLLDIASFSRREGLLALTPYLAPLADSEPFLFACLQRLSDNKNYAQLEADLGVLYQQACYTLTQRIRILEQAAGYLPTMGLMGALLGILQVFSQPNAGGGGLTETTAQLGQMLPFASELTASFSATLLGIGLANWACLPLAQAQQKNLEQLQQKYALIIEGVLAIHRNEHPLQLQETLKLHLQSALIQAGVPVNTAFTDNALLLETQRSRAVTTQPKNAGVTVPNRPKASDIVGKLSGHPPFLAASTTPGSTTGLMR
jgi:chemotaxis protein MotA